MKIKLLPLLALVPLFFGQCVSNQTKSGSELLITRDNQSTINIQDVFDDYKFIYLEMTDSVLVGLPQKIICTDERLFVSDGTALFQFSHQGEHLRTLRRKGRGPGEYNSISDFALTDNGMLILDMFRKELIQYDFSGKHIDTYPLNMYVSSFVILDNCKVLLTNANQRESDNKLIEYDLCTKTIGDGFWPVPESHSTYRHFTGQNNFYHYNGMLLFHEPMNNTIYRIADGKSTPHHTLNIFSRNPPKGFWDNEYVDVVDIMDKLNTSGYCYGTPYYAEGNNLVLFTYREPEGYRMCLYDKRTDVSVQFDAISLSSDGEVSVAISSLNITTFDPDNIIFGITGDKFFDKQEKLLSDEFSAATLYGNPVICIASLP